MGLVYAALLTGGDAGEISPEVRLFLLAMLALVLVVLGLILLVVRCRQCRLWQPSGRGFCKRCGSRI